MTTIGLKGRTLATEGLVLLMALWLAGCATSRQPADHTYLSQFTSQELNGATAVLATQPPKSGQFDAHSTLRDYLTYAALHNPGLKAAFARWKAALEKIPQVRALPDPRFTYGYYIQSVETRVGPQNQSFTVAQMFPWFGKLRLRGSAAGEEAQAQKALFDAAKVKLFYSVKNAYYEYYYLGRAIAVTKQNLDLDRYLEKVTRTMYTTGTASYGNVLQIQVAMGKLEDRLKSLQDLQNPTVAKLNAALNRPSQAPLPWPTSIQTLPVKFTAKELLSRLKQYNPELKAMRFEIAKAKTNIDLAHKQYFPDFTLGVHVIDTGQAINPATPDSGKDAVLASVSINVPIWFAKYRAAVREARAQHQATSRQWQNRENTLAADLQLALYHFRDADRRMNLYHDGLIPKANQSLDANLRDFEVGTGSFQDVIQSELSLLHFQLAFERALTDRAQRLAELEMLVGKPISRQKPDSQASSR